MALGKRKHQQQEAWVATTTVPMSLGHPLYKRLNQPLAETGVDAWIEELCEPYCAVGKVHRSIPPGHVLMHDPDRLRRGRFLCDDSPVAFVLDGPTWSHLPHAHELLGHAGRTVRSGPCVFGRLADNELNG